MAMAVLPSQLHVKLSRDDNRALKRIARQWEMTHSRVVRMLIHQNDPGPKT